MILGLVGLVPVFGLKTQDIVPSTTLRIRTTNVGGEIVPFDSDEKLDRLLQQYSNTSSILLDVRTNTAYSDINSVYNGAAYSGNSTLAKKNYMTDYNGLYQTWKQWKIAQQRNWWLPWYQICLCIYTGLSSREAEYIIGWQNTLSGGRTPMLGQLLPLKHFHTVLYLQQ